MLLRLNLLKAAPYGDETAHFTMARTLGFLDKSVYWIDLGQPFLLYPLVVGRPIFALAHAPGALFGFEGFRLLGMAYSALIPVLVYALARSLQVGRWASVLGASFIALHPVFVVWGSRVFPDTIMAVLALGAILAYVHGRTRTSAALVLLACLAKETAFPVGVGLTAHALGVALQARGQASDGFQWRPAAWLVGATLLGMLGVIGSYLIVPRLPGWTTGGTLLETLDVVTLWPWLLVTPLLAIWKPRFGPVAMALVSTIGFYVTFVVLKGGSMNAWYIAFPASLAVLLAFAAVDLGMRKDAGIRLASCMVASLLVFAGIGSVVGLEEGREVLHPWSETEEAGIRSSVSFAKKEFDWLQAGIDFHVETAPVDVVLLDLGWFWLSDPFRGAERTAFSLTLGYRDEDIPRTAILERIQDADLVWMQDWNQTFHQEMRERFGGCKVFERAILVAFDPKGCMES